MFRALLRFLIFEMPLAFISGITYILYEKEEIISTQFKVRKQKRNDFKKRVLVDYLDKCYRQVHESEKADEKRLDKD
jgi:hypothetical protein